MTTATAKKSASKYTPEMEAIIRSQPVLNQEVANDLATRFGPSFTGRSVIAKINRMGLTYQRKVATTKAGGKVESKEDICKEISAVVTGNLDGLDKAPKPALQALRDALAG